MDFSVVIPTYNSSGVIEDTLESVINSAGDRVFEILIVDDLSEDLDKLKAILSAYPEVRLIEKKAKTNASDSRNIGILKSLADIVFLLDSDDCFDKYHIQKRCDLACVNKAGLIFGRYKVSLDKELLIADIPEYKNNENMRDYLFSRGGDFRSSLITINKKFFQGSHFDKLMEKHQDWGFAILAHDAGESILFDNNPGVIINVTERDGRMSKSSNLAASDYFINNYLFDIGHINSFCIRMAIGAARNNDPFAKKYFLSFAKREKMSGKDFAKYWLLRCNLLLGFLRLQREARAITRFFTPING